MSTTITRWDPYQQIADLQREIERMFTVTRTGEGAPQRGWMPAVDVEQTDTEMVLKLDLPGMRREDVSIEVKDHTLIVSGERREEKEKKHEGYVTHERIAGRFTRSFMLPEGVDPDQVHARFDDGVLTVRLPRPKEQKPRQVQIEGESKSGNGRK
jgi:HSP20 family protein